MNLKRLLWTAALRGALPIQRLFAAGHYEHMFYRPVLGKIDASTAVSGVTAVGADEPAEQSSGFGTDTAEYHERRGSSFFDGGQYPEAEDSYREAIKLDPGHARFFHNLGTALFAQNRYDRAESAEREAVRLAPGDPEFHNTLGRYLLAQERYPEAEAVFRESLDLCPDQPEFLNDLGRSLFPQERYAEAEAVQRQAIEIVDQEHAAARTNDFDLTLDQ